MYNFTIPNCDTDAITFCKPDMAFMTPEERNALIKEMNDKSPEYMVWADDGYYPAVLVLKAKNYAMLTEDGKIKIKGSALKSSKTEKKLREFSDTIVEMLLHGREAEVPDLYKTYVKQCFGITDMTPWTKKVTVTSKVLEPKRTNEQKILDAIGDRAVQEGDKIYVFYKEDESLCLLENFDGSYDAMVLVTKLYKTVKVFEHVLDINQFVKYNLKKSKTLLEELLNAKA